jgi:hypothetical protein
MVLFILILLFKVFEGSEVKEVVRVDTVIREVRVMVKDTMWRYVKIPVKDSVVIHDTFKVDKLRIIDKIEFKKIGIDSVGYKLDRIISYPSVIYNSKIYDVNRNYIGVQQEIGRSARIGVSYDYMGIGSRWSYGGLVGYDFSSGMYVGVSLKYRL